VQIPGAQIPAAQSPGASVAKVAAVSKVSVATPAAVTSAPVASAPAAKVVRSSPALGPSESADEEGPHVVEPEPAVDQPKPVERVEPKVPENVPAKIVSEAQPPLPPWAKSLDVGTVVKLDAVIDEKGNLETTRIVSGPRLLRRAAEQAVQLWIFEPAELDGKPAASHMVLTVEFQR
jgi:hypothetical protein